MILHVFFMNKIYSICQPRCQVDFYGFKYQFNVYILRTGLILKQFLRFRLLYKRIKNLLSAKFVNP